VSQTVLLPHYVAKRIVIQPNDPVVVAADRRFRTQKRVDDRLVDHVDGGQKIRVGSLAGKEGQLPETGVGLIENVHSD
jgi:hypothetical protein